MGGAKQYQDGWWVSEDGIRLHYRDYPGPKGRPPILCLPGLTRNARDFEALAERLAGDWRVICIDLRGRGESGYAQNALSYKPLVYLQDLDALLAHTKIKRFVAIGTSLGGLLTMMLAASRPNRIVAAVLNDIGPEIETAGLDRIRAYAGKSQSWPTWVHAARGMAELQAAAHPGFGIEQWLAFAKRTCRLSAQGRIVLDYDMKIAAAMQQAAEPVDLWPALHALGDAPTLVVRGAQSDILSAATARRMVKELPNATLATVKGVGHAPTLEEAEARRAIDQLLKAVAA